MRRPVSQGRASLASRPGPRPAPATPAPGDPATKKPSRSLTSPQARPATPHLPAPQSPSATADQHTTLRPRTKTTPDPGRQDAPQNTPICSVAELLEFDPVAAHNASA